MTKADKRKLIALLTKEINAAGNVTWEAERYIHEGFVDGPVVQSESSPNVTLTLEFFPPAPTARRRKLAHA